MRLSVIDKKEIDHPVVGKRTAYVVKAKRESIDTQRYYACESTRTFVPAEGVNVHWDGFDTFGKETWWQEECHLTYLSEKLPPEADLQASTK